MSYIFTNLLKKLLFVLALLAIGFGLEFIFYRRSLNVVSIGPKFSSKKRILIVGNSFATIVPSGLETALRERGMKRHEVHLLNYHTLTSTIAVSMIAESLDIIRPKVVMLMLGLHERDDIVTVRKETRIGLLDRSLKNDRVGLNKFLVEQTTAILTSPDAERELKRLSFFIGTPTYGKFFNSLMLEKPFLKILDLELTRRPIDRKRILGIFAVYQTARMMDFKGKQADVLPMNLHIFIREGGRRIQNGTCPEEDNNNHDEFDMMDWRWLCFLHSFAGSKGIIEYINQHPEALYPYRWRVYMYSGSDPKNKGSIDRRIESAFRKFSQLRVGGPIEESEVTISNNVFEIHKILMKKGIKLVLLQYPNLNMKMVSETAQSLGIRSVDGRPPFNKVSEENYYQYFVDKLGNTGHTTFKGAVLYGHYLIDELPDIFTIDN